MRQHMKTINRLGQLYAVDNIMQMMDIDLAKEFDMRGCYFVHAGSPAGDSAGTAGSRRMI